MNPIRLPRLVLLVGCLVWFSPRHAHADPRITCSYVWEEAEGRGGDLWVLVRIESLPEDLHGGVLSAHIEHRGRAVRDAVVRIPVSAGRAEGRIGPFPGEGAGSLPPGEYGVRIQCVRGPERLARGSGIGWVDLHLGSAAEAAAADQEALGRLRQRMEAVLRARDELDAFAGEYASAIAAHEGGDDQTAHLLALRSAWPGRVNGWIHGVLAVRGGIHGELSVGRAMPLQRSNGLVEKATRIFCWRVLCISNDLHLPIEDRSVLDDDPEFGAATGEDIVRLLDETMDRVAVVLRDGLPDGAAFRVAMADLDALRGQLAPLLELSPPDSPVEIDWGAWQSGLSDVTARLAVFARSEEFLDWHPRAGRSVVPLTEALASLCALVRDAAADEEIRAMLERYETHRSAVAAGCGA